MALQVRSIIFITAFALGVLPILTLVTVNLSGHIDRHEQSARSQALATSEATLAAMEKGITSIRTEIARIIAIPEVRTLLTVPEDQAPVAELNRLSNLLNTWFVNDYGLIDTFLVDTTGSRVYEVKKLDLSGFTSRRIPPGDSEIVTASSSLLPQIIIDPLSSHPYLKITTPILDPSSRLLGHGIFRFDLAVLSETAGPPEKTLLIDATGHLLHSRVLPAAAPGVSALPPQSDLLNNRPFLQETPDVWTVWIPLAIEPSPPMAWLGTVVDRREAKKWQNSLIKNIVFIIVILVLIIFLAASRLAARIDRIKEEILIGLDRVLNCDEEVLFNWQGPSELTNMGQELTLLGKQYIHNSRARKQAEAELMASEVKFRNLTSTAQDAIVMMDHHGDISYWNLAAAEIFGYSRDEALGRPIHLLITPRLAKPDHPGNPIDKKGKKGHQGPIRETIELITTTKDGLEKPIELSLSEAPVLDQWHSIWIIRDISERVKAQEEAAQHQQQLIQADKMISLGLLVSGVAHEINNPNSIAMLNSPMLARAWQSITAILEDYYSEHGDFLVAGLEYSEMRKQIPRLFKELEESSRRIKTIVQDLKDYARRDTTDHMEKVDLNRITQAALRLTRKQIENVSAKFTENFGINLPLIRGNAQRLEQIIINLIQNSCEALPEKDGEIIISTGHDQVNKMIFISVVDNGSGIPREMLQKVTDPFFTTKRARGGTGLGLSVSAGIIKEHKGSISFNSEPGRGTEVRVAFPAVEE